jgi:hypothetical protein
MMLEKLLGWRSFGTTLGHLATIVHLSQCQCGHTIDDLGIDLWRCPCESEHIVAHDMLQNTITTIALESGVHVQRKVSHIFPTTHIDEWILSSLETIFEL